MNYRRQRSELLIKLSYLPSSVTWIWTIYWWNWNRNNSYTLVSTLKYYCILLVVTWESIRLVKLTTKSCNKYKSWYGCREIKFFWHVENITRLSVLVYWFQIKILHIAICFHNAIAAKYGNNKSHGLCLWISGVSCIWDRNAGRVVLHNPLRENNDHSP